MVYYWIRLTIVFLSAYFSPKRVAIDSSITVKHRVTVFDCEGLRYMSNTRYVTYMDLIRFRLTFKSNLFNETIKKGTIPTLASQKIIYKKPLKLWDNFSITLTNLGWDNKWVYHSHVFKKDNDVYAIGYTKVGFWKNKKVQDLKEILTRSGIEKDQLVPPTHILNLFKTDTILLRNN